MSSLAVQSPPALPSIQEMFPEHLLSLPPSVRLSIMTTIKSSSLGIRVNDMGDSSRHVRRPSPKHASNYPFPTSASNSKTLPQSFHRNLQHNAPKSTDLPESEARYPPSTSRSDSSISPTWTEDDNSAEQELDESEDILADPSKKHMCRKCSKRFNRPSSLRIHENTHTGETPFRCPYPGCGRMFNVNSNMRRHYRNHVTASSSLHGPEIDPSILPRQRKRRNIKQTEPAPGTSDIQFPSFGGATAAPVLKKAQWSCNETRSQNSSDSDDSTDDNMDVDTDRSHPIPVPPDQRSWRSGPQCHFNYPVYVPRKDRANRANPDPMHTSPSHSCEPSSPLRDDYTNHERRSSPSHSPRSSLYAIANLIR
ncbi:hypothetical protein VKT23_010769 [Stygiomarasmius scandens]|uniref:C2H2-type domain-containing protein n=1 Tax=Marasmiellus scandens TaxID=2682957 RepID=A0ABR1JAS4_9AGAR